MQFSRFLTAALLVLGACSGWSSAAYAGPPTTVSILFDGTGDEAGVTTAGTTSFSFMGSNWSGGVVDTAFTLPLYASGSRSWESDPTGSQVTFDAPIDSVVFFYVHGFGFGAGTATAFDAADNPVAMAPSNAATFFGDLNNFVTLDGAASIARVEFSSGVIDNFTFTTEAVVSPDADFERGDCNTDGGTDIADAISLLGGLFPGPGGPPVIDCEDACDANDDGALNIADAIALLDALFGMPPSPLPAPTTCGQDPTADSLTCVTFASCP